MDKAISTWLASSLNIVLSYISLIFTWLSEFGVVVIAFCLAISYLFPLNF